MVRARGQNLDGRSKDRGVDLNRNWDSFWVVDWPGMGAGTTAQSVPVSSPFSEPETALCAIFS
jgi:hypothetical protein